METDIKIQTNAINNLKEFFKTHDVIYIAENAVFKNMTTGEEINGRNAIADMLNYMYHIAFDAKAIVNNTVITKNNALLEASFVGKHIGEFAGIAATGKQVNVPLCVTYDLNEDGLIQNARIYMLTDVMMQQLKNN
jgi:predicted ester cyclase